jgi:endonuclease YncB( thermonuclease family)
MSTYQVLAQSNVIIVEIESNPSGSDNGNEWVKLYNPTNSVVDISGWMIKSTHGKTNTQIIPNGVSITSTGYYLVKLSGQFLDNENESVILADANGSVIDKTGLFSDTSNDNKTWKNENYLEKKTSKSESTKSTIPSSKQSTCKGTALCISGQVTKIVDGDTIYLKDYKIRLSLTNTPEKYEKGFKEATSFTSKLCPVGSTITVDQDDGQVKGSYGRMIAKVYCGKTLLNSALLDKGLGTIDTRFCSVSEFANENWAKKYGCKF